MIEELIRKLKDRLTETIGAFKESLRLIRSGRAEVGLVDSFLVEAYGRKMLMKELATITVPEPRQIIITPWDKTILPVIDKALKASPAGLVPIAEANFIRINIPSLTAERREELIKMLKVKEEEAKVTLRNVRHEFLKELSQLEENKVIGEDEKTRGEKRIQEAIEMATTELTALIEKKSAEIREV